LIVLDNEDNGQFQSYSPPVPGAFTNSTQGTLSHKQHTSSPTVLRNK
jgi:hypothetical protein